MSLTTTTTLTIPWPLVVPTEVKMKTKEWERSWHHPCLLTNANIATTGSRIHLTLEPAGCCLLPPSSSRTTAFLRKWKWCRLSCGIVGNPDPNVISMNLTSDSSPLLCYFFVKGSIEFRNPMRTGTSSLFLPLSALCSLSTTFLGCLVWRHNWLQ